MVYAYQKMSVQTLVGAIQTKKLAQLFGDPLSLAISGSIADFGAKTIIDSTK